MRVPQVVERTDEDAAAPPAPSLKLVRESLARSEADAAAGRVVEGSVVLGKLRAMVAAHRTKHDDGQTHG
jgi:hypothetical protein